MRGEPRRGTIEALDDAAWESDLRLKLMAAVRLTRLALPQLRASHGAVLFTLAVSAKAPGASSEPSSVTRAAGMALMKALSKELAPDGIRVNAILIGLIESGQWVRMARTRGSGCRSSMSAWPPMPESHSAASVAPPEFADLGCYLLSPRASYLTGTAINLDGGLSPVRLSDGSVVALGLGGVADPCRLQPDGEAVDDVQPGQGVDVRPSVTAPLGLGSPAGRFHVLGHDEHHLMVLAHPTRREFATQERHEEVHAGIVASTKGS